MNTKSNDTCQECTQLEGVNDAFDLVMKSYWNSYQVQGDETEVHIAVGRKLIALGFESEVPPYIKDMILLEDGR